MKDEYAQFVVAQIREAEAKLTEAKRALTEIKKELRQNPYGADFDEQSQLLIDAATEILWAQSRLRMWDKHIPRYVIVDEAQYQNLQLAADALLRALPGMMVYEVNVRFRQEKEGGAHARRKFKAGDVVFLKGGYWGVSRDEEDDGTVHYGSGNVIGWTKANNLELVCAKEDRKDCSRMSRKSIGSEDLDN